MARTIPSKILVIRFSSIGDIVLTEPALRELRARYPESRIEFLTKAEFGDLVRWSPWVDGVIAVTVRNFGDLKALRRRIRVESYELIVDLHGSLRSRYLRSFRRGVRVLRVRKSVIRRMLLVKLGWNLYREAVPVAERYLRALGDRPAQRVDAPDRSPGADGSASGTGSAQSHAPRFHFPPEVAATTLTVLRAARIDTEKALIGFAPAARHFTKRWPMERFVALGTALAKEGKGVIIFGGPDDREYCGDIEHLINTAAVSRAAVSLAGRLSLAETAAAMEQCRLVVSNDTGLMHIAAARGIRVAAIMGPGVPELGFYPHGDGHTVFENEGLRCRPCSHVGRPRCPKGHFRCMTEIPTENVLARIHDRLN